MLLKTSSTIDALGLFLFYVDFDILLQLYGVIWTNIHCFATCEMFVLPSMVSGLGKRLRIVFYVIVGGVLTYFFWSKYHSAMMMMGVM